MSNLEGNQSAFLKNSAIRTVSFYTACPVETCDRCGQGIKYVGLVNYKDMRKQSDSVLQMLFAVRAIHPNLTFPQE
jgi:hypothetical protein